MLGPQKSRQNGQLAFESGRQQVTLDQGGKCLHCPNLEPPLFRLQLINLIRIRGLLDCLSEFLFFSSSTDFVLFVLFVNFLSGALRFLRRLKYASHSPVYNR